MRHGLVLQQSALLGETDCCSCCLANGNVIPLERSERWRLWL